MATCLIVVSGIGSGLRGDVLLRFEVVESPIGHAVHLHDLGRIVRQRPYPGGFVLRFSGRLLAVPNRLGRILLALRLRRLASRLGRLASRLIRHPRLLGQGPLLFCRDALLLGRGSGSFRRLPALLGLLAELLCLLHRGIRLLELLDHRQRNPRRLDRRLGILLLGQFRIGIVLLEKFVSRRAWHSSFEIGCSQIQRHDFEVRVFIRTVLCFLTRPRDQTEGIAPVYDRLPFFPQVLPHGHRIRTDITLVRPLKYGLRYVPVGDKRQRCPYPVSG